MLTFQVLPHISSCNPYYLEGRTVSSILKVGKLRLRELSQADISNKWELWALNSGLSQIQNWVVLMKLGVSVFLTAVVLSESNNLINLLNDQHICDVPSKSCPLWEKFKATLLLRAVVTGATCIRKTVRGMQPMLLASGNQHSQLPK